MRVVVTGAGGFVGKHVLAALAARGVDASALNRNDVDLLGEHDRIADHLHKLRATHLLHLAWYAVPGKFWHSIENYRWPGATVDLVRAFAEAGGTRVTVAGTCAEYDPQHGWCVEDVTPLAPATPYGVAKDAARRLVQSLAQATNISMAWARIFFVYGPGEQSDRLVPSVISSLLSGGVANCTEGRQMRDFLHVADAAGALSEILLSDIDGAVNVCSGKPLAVREVTEVVGRQLGAAQRIRYGAIAGGSQPPLLAGDNTRLRSLTKWTPRFDIESGIADTIAWWRRQ